MCDDLDELLDEVEQKFCSSSPPYKPVTKAERIRFVAFQGMGAWSCIYCAHHCTCRESTDASLSELDTIIHDICDDDPSVNQVCCILPVDPIILVYVRVWPLPTLGITSCTTPARHFVSSTPATVHSHPGVTYTLHVPRHGVGLPRTLEAGL